MDKGKALFEKASKELNKKKPNVTLAMEDMGKAAELGNGYAIYTIGTWYFHGNNGIKQNRKKGIEYWKTAALQNVHEAFFDLGVSHEMGLGVTKNESKAFNYYLQAAICGDAQAHQEVGRLYYYGIGVKKDKETGLFFFEAAKSLGVTVE
ncbi:MAG TPA: tetratricopeptide repeat protein [Bacteroidia bacterium]